MNTKDISWPIVAIASVVLIVAGALLYKVASVGNASAVIAICSSAVSGVVVGLFMHAAGTQGTSSAASLAAQMVSQLSNSGTTQAASGSGSSTSIGGNA